MEELEYSSSPPPPARSAAWARAGFAVAVVSLAITSVYAARLVWSVRHGTTVMTFRLGPVLRALPLVACALCVAGLPRRRRAAVGGILIAVLSFAAMTIMGSRFWP